MKAYRMPDWLYSTTEAVTSWAVQDCRQGRAVRYHRKLALQVYSKVLYALLVFGVWGSAPCHRNDDRDPFRRG